MDLWSTFNTKTTYIFPIFRLNPMSVKTFAPWKIFCLRYYIYTRVSMDKYAFKVNEAYTIDRFSATKE